jgi:hypothetical protein
MTCEEDVFNAVMQWISCDLQQRKQHLPKVYFHLNLKNEIKKSFYLDP